MNFNIISPLNKSEFTATFKDPIVIDKDSKCYLNFAKFDREDSIFFEADQSFTLNLETIPKRAPATGEPVCQNANGSLTSIIPRGSYNVKSLQDYINGEVKRIIQQVSPANLVNLGGATIYDSVTPFNDKDVYVGFNIKDAISFEDVEISAANSLNCRVNEPLGGIATNPIIAYEKIDNLSATTARTIEAQYDNYNLTDKHYFHINYDEIGKCWNPTQYHDPELHYVHFKLGEGISDWVDPTIAGNGTTNMGYCVGLISKDYCAADGSTFIADTDDRTGGTGNIARGATGDFNPVTDNNDAQDGVPCLALAVTCFHEEPLDPTEPYIAIHAGQDAANNLSISNCADANIAFDEMSQVWSAPLGNYYGGANAPDVRFYTYYAYNKYGNPNSREEDGVVDETRLCFKVDLWNTRNNQGKWVTIYDSGKERRDAGINNLGWVDRDYLDGFEEDPAPETNTAAQINASIPFNLFVSQQHTDSYYDILEYTSFDKENNDTNPKCIVKYYDITYNTPELADLVREDKSDDTLTSQDLYPNYHIGSNGWLDTTLNNYELGLGIETIRNIVSQQLNEVNYTIYLNNIPLNSYKNYEKETQGYKKNILANVPLPFVDYKGGQHVQALYQPNFPVIQDMKNQAIRTNNITISIRKMETDEPANDLKQSVINFTIQ